MSNASTELSIYLLVHKINYVLHDSFKFHSNPSRCSFLSPLLNSHSCATHYKRNIIKKRCKTWMNVTKKEHVPRSNDYNLYCKRCVTICFILNRFQCVFFSAVRYNIFCCTMYFSFSSSFYSSLLSTSLEYLFIEPTFLQHIPVQWFLSQWFFSL
jgi:hypothetical protein